MTIIKDLLVVLCGVIVLAILLHPYIEHEPKPHSEYIPLCWNQTVPGMPIYHPAARCNGTIKR